MYHLLLVPIILFLLTNGIYITFSLSGWSIGTKQELVLSKFHLNEDLVRTLPLCSGHM